MKSQVFTVRHKDHSGVKGTGLLSDRHEGSLNGPYPEPKSDEGGDGGVKDRYIKNASCRANCGEVHAEAGNPL